MLLAAPDIWFIAPLLMGLGGLTGFLAGMLGIGGGIILVPCLYYMLSQLHFPQGEMMHMAIGTSHAIIAVTAISSARAHWKRGNVDPILLKGISPGIVCGVAIATLIASGLNSTALKILFSVIIAGLAIVMMADAERFRFLKASPGRAVHAVAGAVIGGIAAILGIGGAVLSVPYMTQCHASIRRAVGTASALGLFIAIPATLGFILIGLDAPGRPPYSIGFVNIPVWALIAPFSVLCAPWGTRVAHNLPVKRLQHIFAIIMILVSANMMFDVLNG